MLKSRARAAVGAALFLAMAAAGCCSTFERDWQAGLCSPPADRLAGLWEGSWESESNGHHGALRAIITPCGPNQYFARYDARFCWFIPYGYDTHHWAFDEGDVTHFQGDADLGRLAGGVYRCSGWVHHDDYAACYTADRDRGHFRMRRVGCRAGTTLNVPPFEPEGAPVKAPLRLPPAPSPAYDEVPVSIPDAVPPRPPQ